MTKMYCSEECLLKDREEKHHEFCQEDAEERKVKRDSKGRVEAGLKEMGVGLKESLEMIDRLKEIEAEFESGKMVENDQSIGKVHSEDVAAVNELSGKTERKGNGKVRKIGGGNSKGRGGAK